MKRSSRFKFPPLLAGRLDFCIFISFVAAVIHIPKWRRTQKHMDECKRQTANPDSNSPWRNKKQLADHYGCSIRTIENLMRGRVLPFVKIRRFIRFNVIECDKAMEKYKQRSALF